MEQFQLVNKTQLALLESVAEQLSEGFRHLPSAPEKTDNADLHRVLSRAASALHDNYPYAHPLYAGQMLKPPHAIARLAYQIAMWINPNNHALDGGRASSAMEKDAVAAIAAMFALEPFLGHLTSSGTIANLEALWIAGEERPGKIIAASKEAHYTHSRLSKVLKLPFEPIAVDAEGRLMPDAVEVLARTGTLGTVVVTAGTTSVGVVDPISDIVTLAAQYDFRVHVDAAYGGYFTIAAETDTHTRKHYAAIEHADSVAIDPHKHGLQPYGCGCILFTDPKVGRHYQHDSPYTYFSSDALHLGEISLECSRAGAAAVALWTTQQLLPMHADSEFADMLNACCKAARHLASAIDASPRFTLLQPPELDIVVWAVNAPTLEHASQRAKQIFEAAAQDDLHLALIEMERDRLPKSLRTLEGGAQTLTCLRSCLMKPEHLEWCEEIFSRLTAATERVIENNGLASSSDQ